MHIGKPSSSKLPDPFTVKRNSDGKLNVVFNDLNFSQKPTVPYKSNGNRARIGTTREETVNTSNSIRIK